MALTAHSRAVEVAGKNLANVNNTNYARQRVLYGDRGTVTTPQGAESLGLEALGVQQIRDALLDLQVLREASLTASFTAEQQGYQRAQAALGQGIDRAEEITSSDGGGLTSALDAFFNAFQSFAVRPTDSGERQSLLQRASILVDRLNLVDNRLAQVQSDLDVEVGNELGDVNRLLDTVADLNSQIGRFEINATGSAVDLRDQRQARLEELAALLPIEVEELSGGLIRVSTRDAGGALLPLVEGATVTGPVAFDGTQLSGGAGPAVLAPLSGSIQGALAARDGAVADLREDLDRLARQLVTSVNAAYNPTGATGDFFTAAGTTAGTLRLASGLAAQTLKASDGGAAGDNTLALAVAQVGSQVFATTGGDEFDGTFGGFLSHAVGRLGHALSSANARVDDQGNIEKLVRSQRDSVSGVSLDEEMADLLKYQRAFQASSRVFNTIDELLDLVVNRLGS